MKPTSLPIDFRTGFGVDVHQLIEGRPLIIGGVEIPFDKGALGHSDADVLLHAIIDALFGAAAKGDIGTHFPDTDPKYKGADSKILLEECDRIISDAGYSISNIDATVMLERPKLGPHIPNMQEVISSILNIDVDRVSIKATTEEGVGYVGEGRGVRAYCTVLVYKS